MNRPQCCFELFNLIVERSERVLKRPLRKGEHNGIFVNYLRFKMGLPPIIEPNSVVLTKHRSAGAIRTLNRKRIHGLLEQGHSQAKVAQMVGCDPGSVNRIAHEKGTNKGTSFTKSARVTQQVTQALCQKLLR